MKAKLHFVLSLLMFLTLFSAIAQDRYWQRTTTSSPNINGKRTTLNKKFYQTFQLNVEAFKSELANAPMRTSMLAKSNAQVYLPNTQGELEQFRVVEAPVLSQRLSRRFPNIKTYLGFSTKNAGVRARFSVTPQGLQAMITSPDAPMNFIVPQNRTDKTNYIVYKREARTKGLNGFECLTKNEVLQSSTNNMAGKDANDQILRTFRIAISTTAEYTNFWDDGEAVNGNAQEDAMAQIVSTLNRSNEIFEVDMAVNFILVTGTEIIFTDPDTDPYSLPVDAPETNNEIQSTLANMVGEANYDIGHLFALDGAGGLVGNGSANCIGCVCVNGQKGSAFSSHEFTDNNGGPYMSDFFDIDYVSHEIGHQMGSLHTHGQQDNNPFNFEPGSGSTIMGYAGITGSNDVQDHSDPYFHYSSIDQILNNLENRTCFTSTPITNGPPIADAGADYVIPIGTAFVLRGTANDADVSDVLTYTWEQIDDGITSISNFGPELGSGPVWRSRPPSSSPNRYMPIIERVISGELTETNPRETNDNSSWETVSNVSRGLNFALTVRDRAETNGVGQFPQTSFDTMLIKVVASAGPFTVTSQTTDENWDTGSIQKITWDVANTNTGSVNTPTVNILLSTDGGFTYPFVMATATVNDGMADVIVPDIAQDTSNARVKVEGNNNIFYAINAVDFSIMQSLSVGDGSINNFQVYPNPNDGRFLLEGSFSTGNKLELNIYDLRGRLVFQNSFNPTLVFNEDIQLKNIADGLYMLTLSDGENIASRKIIIQQ